MHQKQQDDDCRDQDFVTQRMRERRHRLVDQPGSVIHSVNRHAFESRFDLSDFFFHAVDHNAWVLAVSHHDNTANCFGSVVIERSPAEVRSKLNVGNVLNANGYAVTLSDHRLLDVADGFSLVAVGTEKPFAANDVFHAGRFDGLGSNIQVGAFDSFRQSIEWHIVKTQLVGINFDLVLTNVSANGSDFADSFDRLEFVLDDKVLHASQVRQAHPVFGWLQSVVVDLAQSGGVWSELRNNSIGQLRCCCPKLF